MAENLKKIIYSLHPLERKLLLIDELKNISQISEDANLDEAETTTALMLLEKNNFARLLKKEETIIELDKFGQKFSKTNLPEITLLKEIIDGEKKQSEISLEKDEIGGALGILKRNFLINVRKEEEMIFSPTEKAKEFLEKNKKNPLKLFEKEIKKVELTEEQKQILEDFKLRKGFFKETTKKSFEIKLTQKGKDISSEIKQKYSKLKLLENLTVEDLKKGTWKNKEFRHYDVKLETPIADIGRRHPMIEANNILRDVFVEMGFSEMEGPMVESAFWNMDVMWIPQDHPARDEQDTFYLEEEAEIPTKTAKEVKFLHEVGIKRSHTEKGDWSEDIAKKRLLRTHSTATSFRYLNELGEKLKKGEDINGKYFYVAHVFRNEAIDATHLAEFFQGEGFIVGDDLSLADLMGFVKEYYAKFGLEKIRFKPTFNPYTEPSMEAHYYDEKMNKWYALINSGIFREETLKPFGLEKKRVIAWGMGASRVAALLAKKNSMRDITGATCDFEWLKTRPNMERKIIRK